MCDKIIELVIAWFLIELIVKSKIVSQNDKVIQEKCDDKSFLSFLLFWHRKPTLVGSIST